MFLNVPNSMCVLSRTVLPVCYCYELCISLIFAILTCTQACVLFGAFVFQTLFFPFSPSAPLKHTEQLSFILFWNLILGNCFVAQQTKVREKGSALTLLVLFGVVFSIFSRLLSLLLSFPWLGTIIVLLSIRFRFVWSQRANRTKTLIFSIFLICFFFSRFCLYFLCAFLVSPCWKRGRTIFALLSVTKVGGHEPQTWHRTSWQFHSYQSIPALFHPVSPACVRCLFLTLRPIN